MNKQLWITLIFLCSSTDLLLSQQWHSLPNSLLDTGIHVGVGNACSGCGQVNTLKSINNKLYIGGGFGTYKMGNSIATYDGAMWDSLECGVDGLVSTLEYNNGELYAAGHFQGALSCLSWPNDYVPNTHKIAKWNGVQWSTIDSNFSKKINSDVWTLQYYKNDLYIGGMFAFFPVSNGTAMCIVHYNGSTFDNMKGGVDGFPLSIRCMAVYKGELYVAGEFLQAGGVIGYNNIARWDGVNWHKLGTGLNGGVNAMAIDTVNDLLYVGGGFTQADSIATLYYAVWDGNNWSSLYAPSHSFAPAPNAMKFFDGKLFVGSFSTSNQLTDTTFAYWDGNKWNQIYGPNEGVLALEVYRGNLYVGGHFEKVDTTTVNYIACYGDSCPGTLINLTLPYSVHEYNSPVKFIIYPNPTKRELNIQIQELQNSHQSEKHVMSIKNSLGQEIYRRNFNGELKVDTSQFPKGLCLVEVCTIDGKLCHTEKILID